METAKELLSKPAVGMGSSFGGWWLSRIELLTPHLQFAALCLGLLVGIASFTFYIIRIRKELKD